MCAAADQQDGIAKIAELARVVANLQAGHDARDAEIARLDAEVARLQAELAKVGAKP